MGNFRAGYNILKLIHFIAMAVSRLGFTNFSAQEIFTTTLPFIIYLPLKNKKYKTTNTSIKINLTRQTAGSKACTTKEENSFSSES